MGTHTRGPDSTQGWIQSKLADWNSHTLPQQVITISYFQNKQVNPTHDGCNNKEEVATILLLIVPPSTEKVIDIAAGLASMPWATLWENPTTDVTYCVTYL